jgi:hypothetical protein
MLLTTIPRAPSSNAIIVVMIMAIMIIITSCALLPLSTRAFAFAFGFVRFHKLQSAHLCNGAVTPSQDLIISDNGR